MDLGLIFYCLNFARKSLGIVSSVMLVLTNFFLSEVFGLVFDNCTLIGV